jgi:DNA-binding response OmpR family regulator
MSKHRCRTMDKNKNSRADAAAGAPTSGRTNSGCRILVVDKSSDLQLLYTDALAGPGCHVDVAEDGAAAWEALQTHRYNLLITENELPSLTGDELLKKIRSARMDLPVVIVAEQFPEHEPARPPSVPGAATLFKPFALDALLDTVKNVLRTAAPSGKSPFLLPATLEGQKAKQALGLLLQSPDHAAGPIAVILSVRGKCESSQDGVAFAKLERGHVLEQGAIVRTGQDARTDLLLRRTGTSVRLQAGTEIRLEKMVVTIQDGLSVVHTLMALHTGMHVTVVHSTVAGSKLEIRNGAGLRGGGGKRPQRVHHHRRWNPCRISSLRHPYQSARQEGPQDHGGRTAFCRERRRHARSVRQLVGQRTHPKERAPAGDGNVRHGGTAPHTMNFLAYLV